MARRTWRTTIVSAAILAVFVGAWNAHHCYAATIEVDKSAKVPLIIISGRLTNEDGQTFADKISGLSGGVVVLSSPGGSVSAGIKIGTLIQLKKFVTIVPDGIYCASACAIAWLGGVVRYMGQSAFVGFHAAYRMENGQKTETGVGNALIGAYMDRLGLSETAIIYMTSAAPNDIQWLSIGDARALGIAVTVIPSTGVPRNRSTDRPTPTSPKQPAPGAASPSVKEIEPVEMARTFAITYFAHWSENNADALKYFDSVYATTIKISDESISRATLLSAKRKYAERWPERIYIANPATVKAACDLKTATCTVTGRVEWDCRDRERGARTAGLADFTLQISVSQLGAVRINGESSSVVSLRE